MSYSCEDCGELLTEDDLENWYSKSYCCSGHECGCHGGPIDPPWCIKCERIGLFIQTVDKLIEDVNER